MKKILITDDHYVVRMGTAFLLESKLDFLCKVDVANSFMETINKINEEIYDLLILDIDMPDSIYKDMIKQVKTINKNLKILMFSVHDEKQIAHQYINEGADGYINKTSEEAEILKAVNSIFSNGYYYSQDIMKELIDGSKSTNSLEKLSEREMQVFRLLAEGNGNIEISNILDIQMSTISTYKKKIFEKLNVKTVVDLVRIYDQIH